MYQIQTATADSDIAKALAGPKFSPGQIVATPDALAAMEENNCTRSYCWGGTCPAIGVSCPPRTPK